MAQQERALRTRRVVLEAAAEVIAARGYKAATIAEIIERAGVTKGALYFHFPSKQALADTILTEQTDVARTVGNGSPLQQAVDVTQTVARGLQSDALLQAGTRIAVETIFDEAPLNPFHSWIDLVGTLLEEAQHAGQLLPQVDPRQTALLFTAAYTGVQLFSMAESRRKDLPDRIAQLWQHLLPSVAIPAVLPHINCRGTGY